MAYTQGISIDGIHFDIPMISLKRTADVLDKYANRTEDGDLKREVIGVYYNYQLSVGVVENQSVYDALWDKLTEPTEFHEITLPTSEGTYTFTGYVSSVSDEYRKITPTGATFQGLTCKFTAKKPSRR